MTQTQRLFLLVLAAAVFAGMVVVTHNVFTAPFPGLNDFMSRWEGARSFWVDGLNPYGDTASLNIQQRIYGRAVLEGEDPGYFAYPAYTLLLVWPLVYLPYAWASAIWMVVLAASVIVTLFLLFDLFHWKPSPPLLALLILWSLLMYFSARGFILGQPGMLVAALEILSVWALVKRRDGLAAVALALSTIKPQMGFLIVPLLLVWGLYTRRWRFVAGFAAVMAGLLLVSFILVPTWVGDWLAQLGLYPSYTALGSPVWIVTQYYLGLGDAAEWVTAGGLLAALLWAWYSVIIRQRTERFLWAVALTLTVTHLIAPRTATPHYVVFLLPLVFYLRQMSRIRRGGRWVVLALLALLVIPWLHFVATVAGEFEHPTVYLPVPFGLLVLLWLTRRWWWERAG